MYMNYVVLKKFDEPLRDLPFEERTLLYTVTWEDSNGRVSSCLLHVTIDGEKANFSMTGEIPKDREVKLNPCGTLLLGYSDFIKVSIRQLIQSNATVYPT